MHHSRAAPAVARAAKRSRAVRAAGGGRLLAAPELQKKPLGNILISLDILLKTKFITVHKDKQKTKDKA